MPLMIPIGIGEQRAEADDDQRADDGVGHAAAGFADRLRHLGEERQVERRDALRDDVEQDERQRDERDEHGQRRTGRR